ncbi:MAG TPA: hypothetical protein VHH53_09115, partial [Pseudonocardiaceae bacterium]|nr:hypothetical protein [Pseudonocardiaceae bacterium]
MTNQPPRTVDDPRSRVDDPRLQVPSANDGLPRRDADGDKQGSSDLRANAGRHPAGWPLSEAAYRLAHRTRLAD